VEPSAVVASAVVASAVEASAVGASVEGLFVETASAAAWVFVAAELSVAASVVAAFVAAEQQFAVLAAVELGFEQSVAFVVLRT